MKATEISSTLHVLSGGINTGVLISGDRAILFDCCDTVTPERLRELGVKSVDMILCTQHRRPNTAGAGLYVRQGAELVVPVAERRLIEDPAAHWNDWRNRWHVYQQQPGPQVPAEALPVARGVQEGDSVEWEGYRITVLDTPGATDGSVSYVVEVDGQTVCFSGDVLYGPGQVWDLHSLQKGFAMIGDYHGFIGNRAKLLASLEEVSENAQVLVPSHGDVIHGPRSAAALLAERLDALWRNYTATSSLNHYFPHLFDDTKDDPQRLKAEPTCEPPDWFRRVDFTSFAIVSETGAALLIDCGHDSVVTTLRRWRDEGTITSVEGCWITHYHDDHVDALQRVVTIFGCPIITDRHMVEIIEHPQRFLLPCIAQCNAPVARATQDGESWTWHEFQLTAFHLPGQTLYHSGLLVEGHGERLFVSGDSGAPTGIDDHCCGNRNFLGKGRGFRRCIEIWRQCKPDFIMNEHQGKAFTFTDEQLDYMDNMLETRERLIEELVPWPNADFAVDEWWVRTCPYEQEICPGGTAAIDVQFTNHGDELVQAQVAPVLPEGWRWDTERGGGQVQVPSRTDGFAASWCERPDGAARVWIEASEHAAPGLYAIPFRITWGEHYLGQFRHALVRIR